MPVTPEAAAVTDLYRRNLAEARDTTAEAVVSLVAGVDLDLSHAALGRSLDQVVRRSALLVEATGDQAAAASVAYVSAYLLASGADPAASVEPVATDASATARIPAALLWRLGQHAGRGPAIGYACAVGRLVTRSAVGNAARDTVAAALTAEPAVAGWRQVSSGRTCARCARYAGRLFTDREALRPHHPACRCSAEPVLRDRAEALRRSAPDVVAP